MSGDFNPYSDDGKRMIQVQPFGYAIYSIDDGDDPKAETRNFIHRGLVGEFNLAQQWLKDGQVRGRVVTVFIEAKPAKAKSGAA